MADKETIRPKRWSSRRKAEVVLRLLSGELIEDLSREIGVESWKIDRWKQEAIRGIELSLKERADDPIVQELERAKRQIGELSMENELLRTKAKKQGPLVSWRSSK